MEFSRVDEWKSDIQIFLNFYTEQSSDFEDAHYRQISQLEVPVKGTEQRDLKSSKILGKLLEHLTNKKKSKLYLPVHHADK